MVQKEFNIHQYPNGITLLHKQTSYSKIAHCGFITDIGSRDENAANQGIAHFWEHMAFKGTERRSATKIISTIENVGGDLNAYTTKEKIWFHASLPFMYLSVAVDLLTDITFHSIFPEKEVKKEIRVVLEEMMMYRDSPEDNIQDEFESQLFPKHSLGYNILGIEKTVSSFTHQQLHQYIHQQLDTRQTAFVVVSPHSFSEVKTICDGILSSIPASFKNKKRKYFKLYQPSQQIKEMSLNQTHCMVGGIGMSYQDKKRLQFHLLINLLAGPGMSSLLNMALREKKGYVYTIDSTINTYEEVGFFNFYFATDPSNFNKAYSLFQKEIQQLRAKKISSIQLHRLKEQIKGQLYMAEENNLSVMQMMGKSWLDYNRIESLDSVIKKIEGITSAQLHALATEWLDFNTLSTLEYHPKHD
ncbi:MAG: insulinase family protein [Cytophagaceae bacterium]|nr:insulinase family protein [Cytophagaceae bacterium]